MVSSLGGRHGFVFRNRHDTYRALRRKGMTKEAAARIANEGHTKAGRKLMAQKAATTRRGKLSRKAGR